jgi:hypothetical protein
MVSGFVGGGDFRAGRVGAEREAVSDAFCSHQNVRFYPVVLDREHLAAAGKSRLHFVGDE